VPIMDDIQKRADDKAWDEKQNRWISDANRRIENGLNGEALAALHGLQVPPDDEPPYDVDETSEVDNQETLRNKIIRRLIQIGNTISRNRDLPDDVRQRWTAMLQESYASDTKSVTRLRDLRREVDSWEEIDPQSELSLVYSAIGAVATMIEIYQRRFSAR
jgi:hypothetical protein